MSTLKLELPQSHACPSGVVGESSFLKGKSGSDRFAHGKESCVNHGNVLVVGALCGQTLPEQVSASHLEAHPLKNALAVSSSTVSALQETVRAPLLSASERGLEASRRWLSSLSL